MSSVVQRRSRRLQEKNKVELDDKSWTTTDLLSSSVANYSIIERNTAISSPRKNTRKRKRNISTSEDQLQNVVVKQTVKVKGGKQDEKLKNKSAVKEAKQKRRFPKKGRTGKIQDFTPKKELNKKEKCKDATPNLSCDGNSSTCSDDEWEDVDEFDFCNTAATLTDSIEVTIKKPKVKVKAIETVEARRARFIRQHVNQKLRERLTNCHKMHLLCYIAHLRIWVKTLLREQHLVSLCLSVIPEQLFSAACPNFNITVAENFLHWFKTTYQSAEKVCVAKGDFTNAQLHRLEELIAGQFYETDKDLASLLFLNLIALKQTARICLSCQPMPFKLTVRRPLEAVQSLIDYYGSRKLTANDYMEWPEKLEETVEKIVLFGNENQDGNDSTSVDKLNLKRNYWVEFWDENSRRWICLDPWTGSTNKPEAIEANATSPVHYVLCIDNGKFQYGMRDVTARYSSKYLTPTVRRLWVNQDWWNDTLELYQSKNLMRERLEDVAIQEYLFSIPKPTSVSEYKNHPLYVLEKDLSKYEAIYPENLQPVGKIKDLNIYLRSSVHKLEGTINWMKQLRSIKPNEKPYRVVQKRSCSVSSEYGGPKTVDLYGRWQTMPYITPKVVDGRVPRNEFGNLYVYKRSMVPDGCVHLQLNGLVAIARQLGIDCVPAVVGWNHCRGGTHPVLDGCVVLKKHEDELREAWSKQYEKKKLAAKLRRTQRAMKNWRRLVKGLLTLRKVRARFASKDHRLLLVDEKLENDEKVEENATMANDEETLAWPPTVYSLPDVNSK
ncbi:DNA repair protein Rad4 containing protein [Brugia malayi]|uniref:DNA repair protein Rad4 containing protein n=2 Tax=Brugia TaxID=6278 RepID=A0A4E9F8X8_BRUMA|nr:DNA repair protein Rad4 containing protein [Brugia malayi]VIO93276.1 DNA repair protein Rad4 containing protein [Brugia malayi]